MAEGENGSWFIVEQIDHVAVSVSDLAESEAWYRRVMGLERRHQDVWGEEPVVLYAGTTGIALFRADAGRPEGTTVIRMLHICFRTDRASWEQAQARLSAEGIGFRYANHIIQESVYFKDPDGHEIELTTTVPS